MRRILRVLTATLIALALVAVMLPHFLDRRYVDGAWPHMVDGRFVNPDEGRGEWAGDPTRAAKQGVAGPLGFLGRMLTAGDERRPWPARVAIAPTPRATLPPLAPGQMRATWIGHATVLIETPGFTVVTDPIWADRAGPFGIGPKRVAPPAIALADLPRIDAVVVSHNHYDHMDLATLKALWDRDRPHIVVAPGNDAILRAAAIGVPDDPESHGVVPATWGRSVATEPYCVDAPGGLREDARRRAFFSVLATADCASRGVSITPVRNHHWSSRWGADRNRAHWAAFVIDTPSGAVFFAGDTGPGDMGWPAEARAVAGARPIRLAILPIGAFRFAPGQMWSGSHIGPGQAVDAFRSLGAVHGLPVHWGTFRLSWEAIDTPPTMLALERACRGVGAGAFPVRRIGQAFLVPDRPAPPVPARCDGRAIARLR